MYTSSLGGLFFRGIAISLTAFTAACLCVDVVGYTDRLLHSHIPFGVTSYYYKLHQAREELDNLAVPDLTLRDDRNQSLDEWQAWSQGVVDGLLSSDKSLASLAHDPRLFVKLGIAHPRADYESSGTNHRASHGIFWYDLQTPSLRKMQLDSRQALITEEKDISGQALYRYRLEKRSKEIYRHVETTLILIKQDLSQLTFRLFPHLTSGQLYDPSSSSRSWRHLVKLVITTILTDLATAINHLSHMVDEFSLEETILWLESMKRNGISFAGVPGWVYATVVGMVIGRMTNRKPQRILQIDRNRPADPVNGPPPVYSR